jgi:predicted ATPase
LAKINYDKQIIFETHSEHIITRFRRLVKEKKLKPDNIVIYFVDNISGTSKVKKVTIDDN